MNYLIVLATCLLPSLEPARSIAQSPPPGAKPTAAQVAEEDRKFEGTWQSVSLRLGDLRADAADMAEAKMIFKGKQYTVRRGDEVIESGTQNLDPLKSPKQMDIVITEGAHKGKKQLAIYEIDEVGDITICFAGPDQEERPTTFDTKGGQFEVIKYHRVDAPWRSQPTSAKGTPAEQNAAVLYRRAFEALPKKEDKFKGEDGLLTNWDTAQLDGATKILAYRYEPALRLMRRGTTCSKCDWGRLEELKRLGPAASIAAIDDPRVLVDASCLCARLLALEGKHTEAVDELLMILSFVRHLDLSDEMTIHVSNMILERLIYKQFAIRVNEIRDATVLSGILSRYDSLPRARTVPEVLRGERVWMRVWLTKEDLPGIGPEQLKESDRLHEEAIRVAALPYSARGPAAKELASRLETAMPALGALVVGLDTRTVCMFEDRVTAERHLFRAGLKVLIEGPMALQQQKDPYSNQPFQYRKLPSGFELRSALKGKNGEEVQLVFGPSSK